MSDAVEWVGKGRGTPEMAHPVSYSEPRWWCTTHQLLPSNLEFQKDGTVKFTSYVNNLHPRKHASTYSLLEKLIDAALPAWDHALHGYARVNRCIVHPWHDSIRRDSLAQARFNIVRMVP